MAATRQTEEQLIDPRRIGSLLKSSGRTNGLRHRNVNGTIGYKIAGAAPHTILLGTGSEVSNRKFVHHENIDRSCVAPRCLQPSTQ